MNLDKMRIAELEQENKRLALQVEVLSAAFANSSEKEKSLMVEREKLRDALKIAIEDVLTTFPMGRTGNVLQSSILQTPPTQPNKSAQS